MNRPTRRLATAVLIAFGLLGLMASWVQVVAADTYRLDPRNARFNLAQSGKERGLIVSADGVVLARSDPDPETTGAYVRAYPEGAPFTHVVGYSSLLFGQQGLELAYSARTALAARPDDLGPDLGDPGSGPAARSTSSSPSTPICRGWPTRRWAASEERWWP